MADLQTLRTVRLRKLTAFRRGGVEPYPEKAPPRLPVAKVRSELTTLIRTGKRIGIAGRIVGLRPHGGATFVDCADESGAIQLLFSQDVLGAAAYGRTALLDIGDIIAVRGSAMRTRRGEATVHVTSFTLLAKALRPLPSQWYGLRDVDERFRAREIDLLLNADVAQRFRIRSAVLSALRTELNDAGFLEVETPVLQPIAGGATAEPFRTVLRALRMPLYLRVAPELYLKRLLVGGFEKVFELGRAFRNEGMDQTHNPEFTILEFYWAYQDLPGLAAFTERFLRAVIRKARGTLSLPFRGTAIHFGKPFARYSFSELFLAHVGIPPTVDERMLVSAAQRFGVPVGKGTTTAALIDHLFKKTAVPKLEQPTFVFGHPLVLSPLAKAKEDDPASASRFQLVAGGMEIVNAYAELNDPLEQRRRFLEETARRRRGDREAQRLDEDFLVALEYGMPPAAGFGLGVDRFVMLLTDAPSLREVIFFPTMRPKREGRKRRA